MATVTATLSQLLEEKDRPVPPPPDPRKPEMAKAMRLIAAALADARRPR